MNHNPYNLKVGDEVVLDADFNNHSIVIIEAFTPHQMYATVKSGEYVWETMTHRLSPKTNKDNEK
jgi:hypothetical protein